MRQSRRKAREKGKKNGKKGKNGILGGKPTFFFRKKFERTKFGNGEAIRNQAGAVISKTRVTATCQKIDH